MTAPLPHQPADTSAADGALAGGGSVSHMVNALAPVKAACERQAERAAETGRRVEAARAALAEAEWAHQREAGDLAHMRAAVSKHEATIEAARDQRRLDRGAARQVEVDREAHKRRLIEDGLARLGEDGKLLDTFGGTV